MRALPQRRPWKSFGKNNPARMKQSTINQLCREAEACLKANHWALPPKPQWAATDFGLGDVQRFGLVEVLLTNEPEYCEKIMFAAEGMSTPAHTHGDKKEDIICRTGKIQFTLWNVNPVSDSPAGTVDVQINGTMRTIPVGEPFVLNAGERITLTPGIWHEFAPCAPQTLIGEVSTWCDEEKDNFFANPDVDIFHSIEPDEPPTFSAGFESSDAEA